MRETQPDGTPAATGNGQWTFECPTVLLVPKSKAFIPSGIPLAVTTFETVDWLLFSKLYTPTFGAMAQPCIKGRSKEIY